jgi:hypothetical protein
MILVATIRPCAISRLPIDALKIDMAFVHAMNKSADDMAIVSSVISLAQEMRLKTCVGHARLLDLVEQPLTRLWAPDAYAP